MKRNDECIRQTKTKTTKNCHLIEVNEFCFTSKSVMRPAKS